MHELSIANRLVEIVIELAETEQAQSVVSVTIRLGALSCVHKHSLEACFQLVTEGTAAEGATLAVIEVPVTIFCARCDRDVQLPGIQQYRCPVCNAPGIEIRKGQELEIESIEIIPEEKPRSR